MCVCVNGEGKGLNGHRVQYSQKCWVELNFANLKVPHSYIAMLRNLQYQYICIFICKKLKKNIAIRLGI